MRYLVPQFISREIRVVGPMSFRQTIFVGIGAGVCIFLYFTLIPERFILFLILALIIMAGSVSLAFGRYQGMPLAKMVVNFFYYLTGGRKYLWKKKAVVSQAYTPPKYKEEVEEEPVQPVTRKSQLEDLSTRLESYKPE